MAATLPPSRTDQTPVPDYKKLYDLAGRVMVVLGGGNGIGRQTCHALAQADATVVCVDRDQALADTVATEVKGVALVGDVTQRHEVERIFASAGKHGRIRGAIDIVGMPLLGPLASLDDRGWATQFDLVLTHAFLAMQVGGNAIAEAGGGSMVFVASMSGLTQIPGQVAYGTAKAALIQLVAGMGLELGPSHVRVNAVAPGFVRTPRLNTMLRESDWREIDKLIPLAHPLHQRKSLPPSCFSVRTWRATSPAKHSWSMAGWPVW